MTTKDIAKKVINTLPDDSTLEDVIYALYIRAKFDKGEREILKGKGILHKKAKQELQKWVK